MSTKLRNMTSIYITQNNQMLMLYRVGSRVVAPSWCGIGGHFEKEELNDPQGCALRELYEEVHLTLEDLTDFSLRYVTLRLKNGEIRQNYYFFANLKKEVTVNLSCDEGDLKWTDYSCIMDKEMPFSAKSVLEHFLSIGKNTDAIYGSVTSKENSQFIEFNEF